MESNRFDVVRSSACPLMCSLARESPWGTHGLQGSRIRTHGTQNSTHPPGLGFGPPTHTRGTQGQHTQHASCFNLERRSVSEELVYTIPILPTFSTRPPTPHTLFRHPHTQSDRIRPPIHPSTRSRNHPATHPPNLPCISTRKPQSPSDAPKTFGGWVDGWVGEIYRCVCGGNALVGGWVGNRVLHSGGWMLGRWVGWCVGVPGPRSARIPISPRLPPPRPASAER